MQRIPTQNQQATARWRHQERSCRALLSLHGNNNRGVLQPECDLRYQRCAKNHQEPSQNKQEHHSPTKRNAVVCPRNEPGLSAHWPQSGGQAAHLSFLPSTGSGKPALKHLFQESLFFFFYYIHTQRESQQLWYVCSYVDVCICLWCLCVFVCVRVCVCVYMYCVCVYVCAMCVGVCVCVWSRAHTHIHTLFFSLSLFFSLYCLSLRLCLSLCACIWYNTKHTHTHIHTGSRIHRWTLFSRRTSSSNVIFSQANRGNGSQPREAPRSPSNGQRHAQYLLDLGLQDSPRD